MRFRNSLRITVDNYGNTFKLLLYRLVTGLICFSLIFVILSLSLEVVTGSAETAELIQLIKDFLRALVSGDTAFLNTFPENFKNAVTAFWDLIANNGGAIAGAIVGVILIYLLSRFANGLAVFAVGNMVNDRMSVFARTPFSSAYFKNIGSAALYQVVYTPLSFLYDALSIAACWLFFFYAPSFLPSRGFLSILLALMLTITAIVALQALKMTAVSGWMPAMIADKLSLGAAIKKSFGGKDFLRRYGGYLAAVYSIVVVNVICAIATIGSALLITVPMSYIFLLAMQFVNYFNLNKRKYFVSLHKIADGSVEPTDYKE